MPVASVCPVHGPFRSRVVEAYDSAMGSLSNSIESCPVCGRISQVMEGVYSFDADGIATAIAAPAWSVFALNTVQSALADIERMVDSPDYSDERIRQAANARLDRAEREAAQNGVDEAAVAGVVERLRPALDSLGVNPHARKRLKWLLASVASIYVTVSNLDGFLSGAGHVAQFVQDAWPIIADVIRSGEVLSLTDLPDGYLTMVDAQAAGLGPKTKKRKNAGRQGRDSSEETKL